MKSSVVGIKTKMALSESSAARLFHLSLSMLL